MGLIPAHAGKTRAPFWHSACQAAHPRSRGENTTRPRPRRKGWGSSPLTRGKLSFLWCVVSDERLIPAHAGKTRRPRSSRAGGPAHPRSRGENSGMASRPRSTTGSSPLTRGKRWYVFVDRFAVMAHPRSRGENPRRPRGATVRAGSSPLTRGKPSSCTLRPRTTRLIPAHAGKTRSVHGGVDPEEAHPRSRGENIRSIHERRGNLGSSPLTRGKLPGMLHLIAIVRLIPAHAGKTVGHCACKHHGPAHPRSRGENATGIVTNGQGDGSSPLTRGKRSRSLIRCRRLRLIPAHAGKTSPLQSG